MQRCNMQQKYITSTIKLKIKTAAITADLLQRYCACTKLCELLHSCNHSSRIRFLRFFQNPKKRDFLRFFEVSCQKNVKNVESLIQVSCTQIRLPVSDDYKIGYFPKCRLLGAL